ncbi:cobyric acid synthase [Curvivirga sp.]|uniref:cobyric acid synthase n=1 Tax=Curvivirga sp. TaxID=2856848 RepID=UPI003B593107
MSDQIKLDQMIPSLMFQGTGSDVGKSLLVAGICRAMTRRGIVVRPFKPQNMSNNAAVTSDGGEIGRAQALQARACGVKPSVHMNPVLLKPQSDMGSQVVVQGQVMTTAKARDYYTLKSQLLPKVLESFVKLSKEADIVLVEGAGSPAEVNLRAADIANMGFAEAANVPVILVSDIDRGGVIASIVGTYNLLSDHEKHLLKGYIINKFRGDVTLFETGHDIIRDHTNLPTFGTLTWFDEARKLPAEDAVALEKAGTGKAEAKDKLIKIAVPRLGRIANFDDLDPLQAEPDVQVVLVQAGEPIPGDVDLIILPGSKTTMPDLKALREQGWDIDIQAHLRRGGHVLGICAGFQMLGTKLADPQGIEGPAGEVDGLGLIDMSTTMSGDKRLVEISGVESSTGKTVYGYEMHMGRSEGKGLASPMLTLEGHPDGAVSQDGRIMGCYLHGLFASDSFRNEYLRRFRAGREASIDYEQMVDAVLDRFADHCEAQMDISAMIEMAKSGV